jgi:hypothetical protein
MLYRPEERPRAIQRQPLAASILALLVTFPVFFLQDLRLGHTSSIWKVRRMSVTGPLSALPHTNVAGRPKVRSVYFRA